MQQTNHKTNHTVKFRIHQRCCHWKYITGSAATCCCSLLCVGLMHTQNKAHVMHMPPRTTLQCPIYPAVNLVLPITTSSTLKPKFEKKKMKKNCIQMLGTFCQRCNLGLTLNWKHRDSRQQERRKEEEEKIRFCWLG